MRKLRSIAVSLILFLGGANTLSEETPPPTPPHHAANGGFTNPHPTFSPRGFGDFLRFAFLTDRRKSEDEKRLALAPPELRWRPTQPRGDWEVSWVGHSTLLVGMGDFWLLTDPIWSERASPVSFAGPRRYVPPGIPLETLPAIKFVLLSHNHYDHFDRDTLAELEKWHHPHFFVPLGLGPALDDLGITRYHEMDWWESQEIEGGQIHCVPAQHFSGRTPWDRNETLWAGWVVKVANGAFYFAGDTGYSPDFIEIHKRLGPIRLAALPIGAYDPRDFMGPVHLDPAQALQAHLDLKAWRSVGIHWGTFRLANDPLTEGPTLLREAMLARGVDPDLFWALQHGEARGVPPLPGLGGE